MLFVLGAASLFYHLCDGTDVHRIGCCGRGRSASDMWLCPVLRCIPTVGSQGNHSALPSGGRLSGRAASIIGG